MTVPALSVHVPTLGVAETNLSPLGKVSVIIGLMRKMSVLVFVAVVVKVTDCPVVTVLGLASLSSVSRGSCARADGASVKRSRLTAKATASKSLKERLLNVSREYLFRKDSFSDADDAP